MKNLLQNWQQDHSGQALTEYALILAVIAIAAVAVMTLLGEQLTTVFNNVLTSLGGGVAEA